MKSHRPTLIGACLLVFAIPIIVFAEAVSSNEVLTNDEVIMVVKAGLPPSLIVAKIRNSKTNFNTDSDESIVGCHKEK